MPNIAEITEEAAQILRRSGIAEPRREARSLLTLALGRDLTFLIAHPEHEPDEAGLARYRGFVERRARREPFQHIAGRQEFWGLDFVVTPDVLIPRPETEMIVEAGTPLLAAKPGARFCEIGVGSGCISVALLHEAATARALGTDVSAAALEVARRNAETHGVAGRLDLLAADVFGAFGRNARFDLIVSNPPYVPAGDLAGLAPEVRDFDPRIALTDGADGISIIRRIVAGAPFYLAPGGVLLLEIGFNQAARVRPLFDPARWPKVELLPDLQGIPRMVRAETANG